MLDPPPSKARFGAPSQILQRLVFACESCNSAVPVLQLRRASLTTPPCQSYNSAVPVLQFRRASLATHSRASLTTQPCPTMACVPRIGYSCFNCTYTKYLFEAFQTVSEEILATSASILCLYANRVLRDASEAVHNLAAKLVLFLPIEEIAIDHQDRQNQLQLVTSYSLGRPLFFPLQRQPNVSN
ncbi:hypothetical protein TNCV_323191 [Trichonephila clavipes]|nr:hypothetical protein TNCV_323191 [Trichonephila clavipes]